eukprot:TRINITY_DN7633_c0_g1_i2.p1 TRINITY_DN7633_c0_g1~~TRINITY_DN7633_c0_g1_i2.p1  ORF type:complete len:536 (+),score=100.28 TRINITY_DN7633_c0_g1_i2:79-1686(+)
MSGAGSWASAWCPVYWPHLAAARAEAGSPEADGYLAAYRRWVDSFGARGSVQSAKGARAVVALPSPEFPFFREFGPRSSARSLPVVHAPWVGRCLAAASAEQASPWASCVGRNRAPLQGMRVCFTGVAPSPLARWHFLARRHGAELPRRFRSDECDVLVCGAATPTAAAAARCGVCCVRQGWLRATIAAGEPQDCAVYRVPPALLGVREGPAAAAPPGLASGAAAATESNAADARTPGSQGAPPPHTRPASPPPKRPRTQDASVALFVAEPTTTLAAKKALARLEKLGLIHRVEDAGEGQEPWDKAKWCLCTHSSVLPPEGAKRWEGRVGNEWWLVHCAASGRMCSPDGSVAWRPVAGSVSTVCIPADSMLSSATHAPGFRIDGKRLTVEHVDPSGPGERAGLRDGMAVLAVAGRVVSTTHDVRAALVEAWKSAASTVWITVAADPAAQESPVVAMHGFSAASAEAARYALRAAGYLVAPGGGDGIEVCESMFDLHLARQAARRSGAEPRFELLEDLLPRCAVRSGHTALDEDHD